MNSPLSLSEFTALLEAGHPSLSDYTRNHIPRLHRIGCGMLRFSAALRGPTLDVGSTCAELYPFIKAKLPQALPYEFTSFTAGSVRCAGDEIRRSAFNCEREPFPRADGAFGVLIFCDVIEHLLVDPMAALIEFNRLLRPGGHLIVNTPNANSADRIGRLLRGKQVATESFYKPTGIYERHNREWNLPELLDALTRAGFTVRHFDSAPQLLSDEDRKVLSWARREGICANDDEIFGPELFCVAERTRAVSEATMPRDDRWPTWMYTGYDEYRTRPQKFPLVS